MDWIGTARRSPMDKLKQLGEALTEAGEEQGDEEEDKKGAANPRRGHQKG